MADPVPTGAGLVPTNVSVVARLRPMGPLEEASCLSVGGGGAAAAASVGFSGAAASASGGGGGNHNNGSGGGNASTLTFRFDQVHGEWTGVVGFRLFSAGGGGGQQQNKRPRPSSPAAPLRKERPPPSKPTTTKITPAGTDATQADIFQHCEPLVDGIFKGLNGTIMGGFEVVG